MRILALLSLDAFRLSMGWALEELGHHVYFLNTVREDALVEAIHMFQPDIFFDMGWDVPHCDPDQVAVLAEVLRRTGLYHVYFAEEDSLHFENFSRPYVERVHPQFVLTRSKHCVPDYKGMGMQSAHLDVGCNPSFHRPVPFDSTYACDVAAVANAQLVWSIYRRRSIADLVVPLFSEGVDAKIWGRNWDDVKDYCGVNPPPAEVWKGVVSYVQTPRIYNSARINVSVQSVEDQISSRTYDILASCGFLLTSDTPGVRERLTPGVHCEVSSSSEETVEKVQYYCRHESGRERVARAGHELALRDFAYQKILPPVLRSVEQDLNRHREMIRREQDSTRRSQLSV